jgi:hypothetical protein
MKVKIKLQIAKFNDGFVLQILEQDMEYTKRVKQACPNGVKCGRWVVHSAISPELIHNRIYLRGSSGTVQYDHSIITHYCEDVDETLREILHAVKKWSTILDLDIDPLKHRADKCFCVSY